jgi:hypothetical protein
MNLFFTFLMSIGRVPEQYLVRALHCLVNSLNYFKNTYRLIVFTNIDPDALDIDDRYVTVIQYGMDRVPPIYPTNIWKSLSFHKLRVAADIIEEYKETPIWIDLDTIVCSNMDHLEAEPVFFIQQGTEHDDLIEIVDGYKVPANEHIQGDMWKIDAATLIELFTLWETLPSLPYYDAQGLFTYAYFFTDLKHKIKILDRTYSYGLELLSSRGSKEFYPELVFETLEMDGSTIIHIPTGKPVLFISLIFEILVKWFQNGIDSDIPVSYTHLRAHETLS